MKITIEGSSRELAEIAKVLNIAATAEKKAGIPPLLTELVGEKFTGKENAPQMEVAEQAEELELTADELTPVKPYTAERAEEIAEITRPENLITSEFYSSPFFL